MKWFDVAMRVEFGLFVSEVPFFGGPEPCSIRCSHSLVSTGDLSPSLASLYIDHSYLATLLRPSFLIEHGPKMA